MTWPTYTGPGPTKVGTMGDSIAALTDEELAAVFETAPYQRTAVCYPGVTTGDAIAGNWHTTMASTAPDDVVIVLGSNDCGVWDYEWNALQVLANQNTILSTLGTSTRVHWVKPYMNPPDPRPGLQDRVAGFITGLTYWQQTYPNLRLVDWPACVYYFTAQGVTMLYPDGVHPTQDGQNLLAYIVGQSVAS